MPEISDNAAAAASDSDEISSGETTLLFSKYQLGKLLGRGAFAKVYHASNIQTGQSVAIKCINKQQIVKGGLISQIKREIAIMRRMHHHHIVKLFEVLATKTKIYFVMEFVKGGELFDKVAKEGRLTEPTSRRYFQQLISAVGYCHAHGVFHRDLKPENLLLDENGHLKVSDFGLSAVTEQIRNDGLLHTLCGTPAYVAPEILSKKGYDGAKVDIWSCGIILFVLNAAYLPFNNSNLMVMYRKIYKGEFRCPKWMSPDLRRFLSRLLDPNPDTRITLPGILRDPWFAKGYTKEINLDVAEEEEENFGSGYVSDKEDRKETFLNAFDIISFSSGFNLSGLLGVPSKEVVEGERFVSGETPEAIIEKIEDLGRRENLNVSRKEWYLAFEGQNGNTVVGIEVYRLTESLVVVEVRSYEGIWRRKLGSLIDQDQDQDQDQQQPPDSPVSPVLGELSECD